MKRTMKKLIFCILFLCSLGANAKEPLHSWHDGPSKQAVLKFIETTTTEGSSQFVLPAERIAVFDNDGTLWSEQPIYVPLAFTFDRIRALAKHHPEWKTTQPFKAVLENDLKTVMASGHDALLTLIVATHSGVTTEDFSETAQQWLQTARHPKTGRLYTEMVYQPMLELLALLESRGYKNYIVSGGGVEFMRPWTKSVYNSPPERVIGSSIKSKFEVINNVP